MAGVGGGSAGRAVGAQSVSPLQARKGFLPPVQFSNNSSLLQTSPAQHGTAGLRSSEEESKPEAELHLPSIGSRSAGGTDIGPMPPRGGPSPARLDAVRGEPVSSGASSRVNVDELPPLARCPSSPQLRSSHHSPSQQRPSSLSPARRSAAIVAAGGGGSAPRSRLSPEPLRRIASAEAASNEDIPAICVNNMGENGAGGLSSSSSESLGDTLHPATTTAVGNGPFQRRGRSGSHLSTLKDFSSLSRSLPSLSEEEFPRRSSLPVSAARPLLADRLPRSGSFDGGLTVPSGVDGRYRHRHQNNPAQLGSRSLASMASPMSSRRRNKRPTSPAPLSLGDLSPDLAAGMLYSKESPSLKRRSKTVSPEPIPEDDVAPSPTIPRRRSPSPQPPVHASGIPVSPLATGGPARHSTLSSMQSLLTTSPRRIRPNNVNILSRSISPARANSLDSTEEQSLTALSPVKELDADDDETDGAVLGAVRTSRSRSLGDASDVPTIGGGAAGGSAATSAMSGSQSHMSKSVTLDDFRSTDPSPTAFREEEEEEDEFG